MTFLSPVRPVAPAAGYIGGKRNLAGRLVSIIERVEHDGYAEPFVGMGGVFLRRRSRPKVEVINDASGDVVNFFRMVQEHYAYFIDHLRFRLASRAEFERLAGQLAGIRGLFIMSINDTPGVRETFGGFHLREVTTTYTVGQLGSTKAAELIVSNLALPAGE